MGHAIEAASHYSGRYNHGESIALGMLISGRISTSLGFIKKSEADRIERLIGNTGLPIAIKGVRDEDIYSAHLHDKKFIKGKNRFILAEKIGKVSVVDSISDRVICKALEAYLK